MQFYLFQFISCIFPKVLVKYFEYMQREFESRSKKGKQEQAVNQFPGPLMVTFWYLQNWFMEDSCYI